MHKCVFYITVILVCVSLIYPIVKIVSSGEKMMIGGSESPASIVLQLPDKAPIFVHYLMLLSGVVYLVSYIIIAVKSE